jgi:uncharacterized membrane protein YgcG
MTRRPATKVIVRNTPHADALKGRYVIAQGAALGSTAQTEQQALKGRHRRFGYPAPSGLQFLPSTATQGVALGYRMLAFQARTRSARRTGFTLFELILAIALSAALLAVIGTAINLYLKRVDMSRTRVEEAQLARSILSMIADDLRATAIYQPQDVSSVASLMASSAAFDVDSIDEERGAPSGGATGAPGGTGGVGGPSAVGTSGGPGGAGGAGTSSGDSATADTSGADSDMPLGLSGSMGELYVDAVRLPRGDELFGTLTGYTNAPMAAPANNIVAATGSSWGSMPSPSALKTVRYFVREGDRSNSSGLAATSLAPEMQGYAGGLVRQKVPRAARIFAEQTGGSGVTESGQVLIAPEVLQIQFRYYDGEQIVDMWDMAEEQSLPLAVEVTIWLASANETAGGAYNAQALLSTAREYRQTVFLPMAELSQSGASGGMSGMSGAAASASSSSSGSTSSGSSTSSSGSGFGEQQ